MKVLQLSSESSWRGGEQQIAYLMEELEAVQLKPMVAGRPASSFEKYAENKAWTFFPLKMKNSVDIASAYRLKKICTQEGIDLLHVHSARSHAIAYLAYVLGNRTPIIVSRRVDFPPKDHLLSKRRYNLPAVKKIVCVSDAIKAMLLPILKDKSICTTIYSGIDAQKFDSFKSSNFLREAYHISDDTLLIGNTSAIAPHKDYYTFIDTAKIIVESTPRPVMFFIIGDGPLMQEIKAYSKEQGMENNIVFTGFLNNITQVLPSLDIFFISSETEGLGTSIIDAFAANVVVVATRAGGIPELVEHGKTGFLGRVKQPTELAELLLNIIHEKVDTTSMLSNANAKAQQLSKSEMARAYYKLYQEVCASEQTS